MQNHHSNSKFTYPNANTMKKQPYLEQTKTKYGDSDRTNYSKIDRSQIQARSEQLLFAEERSDAKKYKI